MNRFAPLDEGRPGDLAVERAQGVVGWLARAVVAAAGPCAQQAVGVAGVVLEAVPEDPLDPGLPEVEHRPHEVAGLGLLVGAPGRVAVAGAAGPAKLGGPDRPLAVALGDGAHAVGGGDQIAVLGAVGVHVGVDGDHVEAAPAAVLSHAAQEGGVEGVDAAEHDLGLGVDRADRRRRADEQARVGGHVGLGPPEDAVVRLVPDLPAVDVAAVAGDDGPHVVVKGVGVGRVVGDIVGRVVGVGGGPPHRRPEHAEHLDVAAEDGPHRRVGERPVPGVGAGLHPVPVEVLAHPGHAEVAEQAGRGVHRGRVGVAAGQVAVQAERGRARGHGGRRQWRGRPGL